MSTSGRAASPTSSVPTRTAVVELERTGPVHLTTGTGEFDESAADAAAETEFGSALAAAGTGVTGAAAAHPLVSNPSSATAPDVSSSFIGVSHSRAGWEVGSGPFADPERGVAVRLTDENHAGGNVDRVVHDAATVLDAYG